MSSLPANEDRFATAMPTTLNPYQSPRVIPDDEAPDRASFRTRFWPVYLLVVAGTTLGLLLVALTVPTREDGMRLLVVLAGTVLLQAVPTAWLAFHFRVHVSEDVLRGFDFWGKYHNVPWSAIRKVRPCSVGWLKYLKLYSDSSTVPIWLPLFLHDGERFWRHVRRWAPQTPLSRFAPEATGRRSEVSDA